MRRFMYKARRSLLAGFLISSSIGFCYAFSLFAPHVQELLGVSKTAVQFAFCLNIFFLGMGAAFFGSLVEKNIKVAAWTSTALLCSGLAVSGLAMHMKNLWLFYLGIGVMCGISEGCGYVTPVKNLLLWFGKSRHKALIMALSIISFGLGSSICSFVFKYAFPAFGIENVFFFFSGMYLLTAGSGALMISKPRYVKFKIDAKKTYSAVKYVKDLYFLQSWLFMFLNISMGLIIIGQCAGMLAANAIPAAAVITIMMLCGLSNGLGRLVFPAISDYLKKRVDILLLAGGIEIAVLGLSIFDLWFIPVAFIMVNACYGCYFAVLPAVLSDHFGNSELSFVHGICLSSWGFASLFAFLVSTFVLGVLQLSQNALFGVLAAVYAVNFVNVLTLRKR